MAIANSPIKADVRTIDRCLRRLLDAIGYPGIYWEWEAEQEAQDRTRPV